MTRTFSPLPVIPAGLTTHNAECLEIIRDSSPFAIEGIHYTASGVCGYFTDPHDGRQYRVSIEALDVLSDQEQECVA